MIPSCFIARLRKLDKGELCLFLDFHYLCGGFIFFGRPDALGFCFPFVLLQWVNLFIFPSASGHVYVAKTLTTGKKVAIKEMDLSHQPRKELIVNEILVMKESQHPNIVNFLESYLVKSNELWLWVVMEYMEGGALTDIIENNTLDEDQISGICLEVSFFSTIFLVNYVLIFFFQDV